MERWNRSKREGDNVCGREREEVKKVIHYVRGEKKKGKFDGFDEEIKVGWLVREREGEKWKGREKKEYGGK